MLSQNLTFALQQQKRNTKLTTFTINFLSLLIKTLE